MENKKSKSTLEIFFIYFEKITILFFAAAVFVMLVVNFKILAENETNMPFYSYFFMNERIIFKNYLVDSYLVPVTQPDTECYKGYEKKDFVNIQDILSVKTYLITNQTKIQDPTTSGREKGILKDLGFYGENYYNFNISEKSNGSKDFRDFNLINKYALNNWKGSNFCIKRLYFDEWFQGLQIINSTLNCTTYFPGKNAIDCGVFGSPDYGAKVDDGNKYMKLCLLKDNVYEDKDLNMILSKTVDEELKNINFCPLNNFDFYYTVNPDFDDTNVNSWFYNFTYFTVKNDKPDRYMASYPKEKFEKLQDRIANPVIPIIVDYDTAYFLQNYQGYPDPNEKYVFGINDDSVFIPGQPYGLTDLLSIDIDYYNFYSVYNDTFYEKKVYDGSTKTYSYEPNFITSINSKDFIVPEQKSAKNYDLVLTKRFLPVFNKRCFYGVFQKNPAFLAYLNRLNVSFLEEFVWNSVTLCLMLAIMAVYNELYIRYYILSRIVDDNINDYDLNSEKFTKYTHKMLETLLLLISIYFQNFNLNRIVVGESTAKNLIKYDCFILNNPPPNENPDTYKFHINDQFTFYIEFLNKLETLIKLNLSILLLIFISMMCVIFSYLYLQFASDVEKSQDNDLKLQIEEFKKNM